MEASNRGDQIELSVITITRTDLSAIKPILAALRAQTARDRMEVVVVAPDECSASPEELKGFGAARVLETVRFRSLGEALLSGVQAASAPVVAYTEEHSYPEPDWAARLIERHRGPWAGVGWAIKNANPDTTASWASMIIDFAGGVAPVSSGERTEPMPWHHVSYKREELLACGDNLVRKLEIEAMLQNELLARGKRLFMEGDVCSRHVNVSRVPERLRLQFMAGRDYGSTRCEFGRWSGPRRLLQALALPLRSATRLLSMREVIARTRPVRGRVPGLVPSVALDLAVSSFGESVGYLWGRGGELGWRLPMELERERFVRAGDPA